MNNYPKDSIEQSGVCSSVICIEYKKLKLVEKSDNVSFKVSSIQEQYII